MVKEMMATDLRSAERDALVEKYGFPRSSGHHD